MAKDKLKPTYQKALQEAGYELTGKETMSKLRNMWKKFRSGYVNEYGTKTPSVYQYARQYTEIPTIEYGKDYLNNFIQKVWQVYRDTISWIDSNKEGTHESGKLASIAEYRVYNGELYNAAWNVEKAIKTYLDSGIPAEVIAEAIDKNVELDYVIAVALIPPSDIQFKFDETVEQIEGLWGQINEQLENLAEQEENKYYGR